MKPTMDPCLVRYYGLPRCFRVCCQSHTYSNAAPPEPVSLEELAKIVEPFKAIDRYVPWDVPLYLPAVMDKWEDVITDDIVYQIRSYF